jgi:carbamoyl-phosphate synthase small subunit
MLSRLQQRQAAAQRQAASDGHAQGAQARRVAPMAVRRSQQQHVGSGRAPAAALPAGRGRALSVRASASASPFPKRNARLVLENGSVWHATAFGATGTEIAEVALVP